MPINWPPPDAPPWPPPELNTRWLSFSSWAALFSMITWWGFTVDTPTPTENKNWFKDADCDDLHGIQGRILISPLGTRYPFAVCLFPLAREFLVLWPPYTCGAMSGID